MAISADIIDAMVASGCTAEQLAAVIRADALAEKEKKAHRREKNRIYQQKHRARQQSKRLQSDVSADTLFPLGGSSPTPPSPSTSISPSPSSLRSSGDAPAHMEFHDNFWPKYPNKVGKPDAERAFAKARRRASLDAILAGLDAYVHKTDDRPWCNPATWLNQDRWNDQPAVVVPTSRGPPKSAAQQHREAVQHELDKAMGRVPDDKPADKFKHQLDLGDQDFRANR